MKINNYINHIAFAIDASSSMGHLKEDVIQMVDNQIQYLADRSKDLEQETRLTIYLFGSAVNCIVFDKDVLRLPSIREFYNPNGMTALIDAGVKSIEDLKQTCTIYGDHSFLLFFFTDGAENHSHNRVTTLSKTIKELPDNWSLAVLVPDKKCARDAKSFGFPENSIEEWQVGKVGVREVGEKMKKATDAYMVQRSKGVRGTTSLFKVDASALTSKVVTSVLQELSPKEYEVVPVRKDSPIKEYCESYLGQYCTGSGYYFLGKKETIQANKSVIVRNKKNGKVYTGDNARKLIGLPDTEVKVQPDFNKDYDLFVQSNSNNRKLIAGTDLIVLK